MKITRLSVSTLFLAAFTFSATFAAEETRVRVNTFPTARSLPFYVGIDKGIFAKHGIKLEVEFTENSRSQREGLAAGKFEVVHSAVDNALAMIEVAKIDVVIVSGGDGGTNEFVVGKGLNSFADIRGKALVVDAPNTAYALQGIKILLKHGLKVDADYKLNPVGNGTHRLAAMMAGGNNAAAIMNLPFSAQAIEAGMKSLGRTTDMLGPYQAGGAFVLRVPALGGRQEEPRRGHRAADEQAEPVALARHPQLRPDDRAGVRVQSGRKAEHRGLQQRAQAAAGDRRRPGAEPGEISRSLLLRPRAETGGKVSPPYSVVIIRESG
jgi:hypothetical protein